jgi:hypothetical protein
MLLSEVMEKYRNKTQNSLKLWIKSKQYLPGGNSRTTVFIPPYPIYVDRGPDATYMTLMEMSMSTS